MRHRAIHWSDNDRYWGPFTYAKEGRNERVFAIALRVGSSGVCGLRFSFLRRSLLIRLPAIMKPAQHWVDTSRHEWSGPSGGYWDIHPREFGLSAYTDTLHLHYGQQTGSSDTDKAKCWFYPWREHQCVRHSLYDLAGELFGDLPQGRWSRNRWAVREAIQTACPSAKFDFKDYDGEKISATCRIEEMEWKRGKGIFKLLFWRNKVRRSLDLHFSSEVGRRKGSWKGGTVGHSIEMRPGELHAAAFQRYCAEQHLIFVGPTLEVVQ